MTDRTHAAGHKLVADYDYHLPPELIAQEAVEPRDASRLLVVHRSSGNIEHRHFYDLPDYLQSGDSLVLNNTRVIPARLLGRKATGGAVEILLLKRMGNGSWEALVKPSRRLPEGTTIEFGDSLRVVMGGRTGDGTRLVTLYPNGDESEVLQTVGKLPLPPYIESTLSDPDRYQTVFAQHEGSAAAPTAGLHFTPELFQRLDEKGVSTHHVTLHVGIGTFRPVMTEKVTEHVMHKEPYSLTADTAESLNAAKRSGARIVAVGTTSCRTLESAVGDDGQLRPGSEETDLFIYPGYRFKMVDVLITNFHLPRSSLLMLVAAFAGKALMDRVYEEAVAHKYRFYSLGDAMIII